MRSQVGFCPSKLCCVRHHGFFDSFVALAMSDQAVPSLLHSCIGVVANNIFQLGDSVRCLPQELAYLLHKAIIHPTEDDLLVFARCFWKPKILLLSRFPLGPVQICIAALSSLHSFADSLTRLDLQGCLWISDVSPLTGKRTSCFHEDSNLHPGEIFGW